MPDRTLAVTAWESLFRAQVSIMRHLNAEFPSEVVSLNEYDVLFNLSRATGYRLRIRDLNKVLLITQPSVSRMVDRLAARELVEKLDDDADRRGTIVQLTDYGLETFRTAGRKHAATIASHVGKALDDAELAEIVRLCNILRASADNA